MERRLHLAASQAEESEVIKELLNSETEHPPAASDTSMAEMASTSSGDGEYKYH